MAPLASGPSRSRGTAIPVVLQEHDILLGRVAVQYVDAVGVGVVPQDYALILPVDKVLRGVAVLFTEAARVSAYQ